VVAISARPNKLNLHRNFFLPQLIIDSQTFRSALMDRFRRIPTKVDIDPEADVNLMRLAPNPCRHFKQNP
jgi:hypothetical protein